MRSNKIRHAFAVLFLLFAAMAVFAALLWFRVIKINHPKGLKGADISSYQGQTDWAELSKHMDFVFVKATEGSGSTDDMFVENFTGAKEAGLVTGAYHFFSFDSSGSTQAENFINALESTGQTEGMLPPVIDVELYGEYTDSPKPADEAVPEIKAMISAIEEKYGTKPIIYTTLKTRFRYKEAFDGCMLWERNVFFRPLHNDWTFWQYSDSEKLDGYDGDEEFIDMNVFSGSMEDLESITLKSQ
ncbi:GH25 family lysozyme [Ruminococcus sp.]|uniref:glycoside hydrolase family 25 protein n=1 Tax=Ruminococcus sp. TaxID=41978 RepID=UPI0025E20068|nr:GH25 family lysozyme [Ruminococcus sp.]